MADNTSAFDYNYSSYEDTATMPALPTALVTVMRGISVALYSTAFVLGVTGNGLVIWVTGFRMARTVNAVWFLHLAMADFVFTLFLPLSMVYVALGFHWPFGRVLCKLNSGLAFLNMFASVFLLTAISVDRCLLVAAPVWAQNHRQPRVASLVALAIWLAALALSSPYPVFRDTGNPGALANVTHCYNNFAMGVGDVAKGDTTMEDESKGDVVITRHHALVLTRFLAGFLVPFAAILTCYGIMAAKMKRNQLARSARPYQIMVAVVGCFFLSWCPYHIFSFLELAGAMGVPGLDAVLLVGVPLASGLAYLNSCLNPVLYVFVGRDFRDRLWRSVLQAVESAFSEPSSPRSAGQGKLV
ncbi:chemokine-like receptor 1 [Alligator sinensis]|uniref:Chemokine-like receptor 1 n=1 Tax=Alligator sinensis TaxID=38654 RepID=A0A1U8DTH4_ALLSI|nr:chemokine-like receptor 1 [Alligator sinensis]